MNGAVIGAATGWALLELFSVNLKHPAANLGKYAAQSRMFSGVPVSPVGLAAAARLVGGPEVSVPLLGAVMGWALEEGTPDRIAASASHRSGDPNARFCTQCGRELMVPSFIRPSGPVTGSTCWHCDYQSGPRLWS